MSKLPTCCEFYNVDCNQRRNCPVDAITAFYAETEGVMPMQTGCSFKAPPAPVKPPDETPTPVMRWEVVAVAGLVLLFTVAAASLIVQIFPF